MGSIYSCCVRSPRNSPKEAATSVAFTHKSVVSDPLATTKSPNKDAFQEFSILPEAGAIPVHAGSTSLSVPDSSSVINLYNRYVNPDMGQISAEGIEQLCNDLNLNPEDFRVLVLAYSLGAQAMCRFTEDEFVNGCLRLGITSVETMKQSIPNLLKSVQGASFTPFYHWTYKFALDVESGQRTLPADLAISLWKLVFYQNCPPILDRWLDFLQQNTSIKGISKDTWDMFLIFVNQIGEDLKSYNDAEAWPSLLDDFVESQLALADNI